MIKVVHVILYVADQAASTEFYRAVLEADPLLNEPGMTEFAIGPNLVLGLMPLAAIARLLGPGFTSGRGAMRTPHGELYLVVADVERWHGRALAGGARELSPAQPRDWGHHVAYSMDRDGHVLAFAEEIADS